MDRKSKRQRIGLKLGVIGIICLMCVMCSGIFSGCEARQHFTNEEHIERITQRVQARLDDDNLFDYVNVFGFGIYVSNFSAYILYDYNSEPNFFLVEFEPVGFIAGFIRRNRYYVSEVQRGSSSCFHKAGIVDERRYAGFGHAGGLFIEFAVLRHDSFVCPEAGMPINLTRSRTAAHRRFEL